MCPAEAMDSGKPTRILIIDDNHLDRELYKRCLQLSPGPGFEFSESADAADGIELAKTCQPDCVLLDVNLPDMDGLEVLGRLKGESDLLPFAVVMLTAFGDEDLAVRAMKAGAMDYLPKRHLNAEILPHTVANAIERLRMQQRIEEQRSALEISGRRQQLLLEAIPQLVWTANAEGRLEYANRLWFEYTGLGLEEAARLGWDHVLHPEDRERTRIAWEKAARSGSVFEIEHRIRRTTDGSFRWYLVRAVPVRTQEGEIANWFGTCTEIEDQKRDGRAVLQKQKLEGMGTLAGGVAHDFNNLLTGILLGTSCAMESLPAAHPAQEMLTVVVQASERAAELTRRMLACAGRGNSSVELTDINQLMRGACEAIRASIPNTILLEYNGAEDVLNVETDSTQMRLVIVDLVMNAVEAIGEGVAGRIFLRTELVEIDEESIRNSEFQPVAIPAGKYAALEVQDTGCGMDEETQSRIFDPFFTTKFVGRGLGLAVVHGFARSHGGGVQVDSAPGKGTRLRVLLPAAIEKQEVERLAAAI